MSCCTHTHTHTHTQSPVIVCPDVDVDKAVADTHFALYFNHGQCCAAGSRWAAPARSNANRPRVQTQNTVRACSQAPHPHAHTHIHTHTHAHTHTHRLYVHEKVYDEFVAKAAAAAAARRVGDPFGDVDQGPQVDRDQHNKVWARLRCCL